MAPTTNTRPPGAAAVALAASLALVGCAERIAVSVDVPQADPSPEWADLLQAAISDDGVDYDVIDARREVLERYLAWVGANGPLTHSWGESKEDLRLAYGINAYNAATILGVLEHRPLDSVRDVDIGLLKTPGAGFFVGQQFYIDGEWTSLHNLEHQMIVNRYQEPLVHVALNCASVSCPPLKWWKAKGLQGRMKGAMRRFVASDLGLMPVGESEPDTPPQRYAASQIFRWYAADFTDWSQAETVCEWMVDHASGDKKRWLQDHAVDCPLEFQPYDWSLNHAAVPPEPEEDAVEPPDDEEEADAGDDRAEADSGED